ncbi:uncharacterized protein LOC115755314 [Rhodamnia argentea]|uniref:Uncharacterized protein LOC115755314 n=1 Tax=Rhodamnia argentea TaxID=178133 RepID=A0ABM3HUN8_9MYRT|nr:uncharacterized protein LOC115755314 [Rhodamnia argentea]
MAESKRFTDEEHVDEKKYFQKVLDDVVSLNSLFTIAVFIGLSFAQPGQVQSLNDDPGCHSDANLRKRLVGFEIASFSCFIFSGVLVKTVKIFLYTSEKQDALDREEKGNEEPHNSEEEKQKVYRKGPSLIGFYLSIYGTMLGCLLLLLAMVDVVQIKLGRLSCHSKSTLTTVCVMVVIIGLSLLIFFFAVTNGLRIAAVHVCHVLSDGVILTLHSMFLVSL